MEKGLKLDLNEKGIVLAKPTKNKDYFKQVIIKENLEKAIALSKYFDFVKFL